MAKAWPSLVVAGSADPYHDARAHAEVCATIRAQSLVVERANHGLVVDADVMATVDAHRALAHARLAFARRHG